MDGWMESNSNDIDFNSMLSGGGQDGQLKTTTIVY